MRNTGLKAEVVRGRAARRVATLLLTLALACVALGSHVPRGARTAGGDGSFGAAPEPAGSAAPPFSSGESDGKIAFASNRGGSVDIYVMNADGTGQSRLTNHGALDLDPAFAPSGSKIVFESERDSDREGENSEIYLMNDDGTNQTRLTNNPAGDFSPAFAPFVRKIAFSSTRDRNDENRRNSEIYLMNDDGTNQVRLTNNPAADFEPAFAPLGDRIVFASDRDGNFEIYMMNANGTNQTRVTNIPSRDLNPTFSPDGSKIAFTSDRDGNNENNPNSEIYLMNTDGTNVVRLTNSPGTDRDPTFSPDGSKIAFASVRDGNAEIYVMNADGTNQTRITNNSFIDGHPSWAPGSVVSLAVNDVSLAEGNSGATLFTFTVTKSGATTENVTVRVDTGAAVIDPAAAPDDYAPVVNQTLTFLPAETTKTVTVTVNGDTGIEPDEKFFVNLSNATNALVGDGRGVGTIVNDDFTRPIRTLLNLLQVVINEQTLFSDPHVIRYTDPNAPALTTRRPDPLTSGNNDFSFFEEEYYDAFYSNADGTTNPDGAFITIEGVWRDRSMAPPFFPFRFGGMNINEVILLYPDGTQDFGDFVSSFVVGSICNPPTPDIPEQCIPGSEARAVDGNARTFPRLGHTSDMNLNERFRLTIGFNGISGPPQSAVQFGAATYNAAEGANSATVTVTRTGDASGAASVNVTTSDTPGGSQVNQAAASGAASERSDYTAALGTLRFAPGETMKTFDVLITDDRFDDDGESFRLTLSDPAGAALGSQNTASVQIGDDDAMDGPSPVREAGFNAEFFVRQHYADFLNRAPDQAGLDFWVGQANGCGAADPRVCRVNVSAAFFLSIENQETGYLAHRAHKAAYGNLPRKPVPLTLREYLAGSRRIADGVQVGIGNWQQRLEANKVAFFDEFVATLQFTTLYQQGMNNRAFVEALNQNAGFALSPAERDTLVSGLAGGTMTRAQVLRAVAEDADFAQAERSRAFVLAQYFGYLRRNPDDIGFGGQPDPTFEGYNFWLSRLNQFNGNFIQAEMVRAFIESFEYGDRFGR